MKLKKILAGILAGALMLGTAAVSVSAGTVTFLPSGSNAKYAIEVVGVAEIADVVLTSGNEIKIGASGVTGGTGTLTNANGTNYAVSEVKTAKLNNANITAAGNGTIGFSLQTRDNTLRMGTYKFFEWSATLVLADSSKHPVNDLGINLNNFAYNVNLSIPYGGKTESLSITSFVGKVVNVSDTSTFKKDTPIYVRNLVNSGRGFTLAEKDRIKAATSFNVTLNLKETVAANDIKLVGFYTDISGNNTANTIVTGNSTNKVVIQNVPKYYFFDEVSAEVYGIDAFFTTFYLTGVNEFTSVVIDYVDGDGKTTTTTTVRPGNTAPSNEGDSAEEEFFLNYPSVTLNVGASVTLKPNMDDVKWSTGSREIVKVYTSGRIQAVKPGTVNITATNANGDKAICKVTVVNSKTPITSLKLSTTGGTVYVGSSYTLKTTNSSPSAHTDKITWTSSDESIASVNASGKVTVWGIGKVIITATSSSGKSAMCNLTAKNTSLKLASSSATVGVGKTFAIKATPAPSSAKVTYESKNEAVATVSASGTITGRARGTADIEVTSSKGDVKVFKVTVN